MNKDKKQIYGDLVVNGNLYDGFRLTFPTETADKLCALYKEALATVLKDIEEEDRSPVFDKWLKEKDTKLYDTAMAEFEQQMSEALSIGFDPDEENFGLHGVYSGFDGAGWIEGLNNLEIEAFREIG